MDGHRLVGARLIWSWLGRDGKWFLLVYSVLGAVLVFFGWFNCDDDGVLKAVSRG